MLALLATFSEAAFAADAPDGQSFLGAYTHAGGAADRKALDEAIERVVSKLNLLIRAIARKRLRETNPIAGSLSFSATTKTLSLTMDGVTQSAPLDGQKVKVKVISGEEMLMHFEVFSDEIIQIFEGDKRGAVNRYRFVRGRLVRSVRVFASQLPVDLVYDLSYARV